MHKTILKLYSNLSYKQIPSQIIIKGKKTIENTFNFFSYINQRTVVSFLIKYYATIIILHKYYKQYNNHKTGLLKNIS